MAHYIINKVDRGAPIIIKEIEWEEKKLKKLKERIYFYKYKLIVKAIVKVV